MNTVMLFPKEQLFSYKGITTGYYRLGTGPEVLFLHGLGATPQTYSTFISLLSKHFTVIVPQIPPFGVSSSLPSSWNIAAYAEFFEAMLRTLTIDTIPVIGHSYGGAIALSLAERSPRVSQVIAINPMGISCLASWKEIINRLLFGTIWGYCRGKQTMQLHLVKDFIFSFLRHFFSLPATFQLIHTVCATPNIEFSAIHQPVVILWGVNEELFPKTYLSELTQRLQNVSIRNIEGYHNWIFFQPEKAVDILQTSICEKA